MSEEEGGRAMEEGEERQESDGDEGSLDAENGDDPGDEDIDDSLMDESESGEGLEKKIADALQSLSEQPDDYETRISLIDLLRLNGDLDELRNQREVISQKFAMSPSFWILWIQDEKMCDSTKESMERLFKRAVADFHSPEVYIEYVQWSCGVSIEFAKTVMEEAVSAIGLRADCASIVWNVYLDLAKMVCSSVAGGEELDPKRDVLDLYQRLLRIPHVGILDTWKDYVDFLEGSPPDEVTRVGYEKALKRMPQINDLEERLKNPDLDLNGKLAIMDEYIELEKNVGDPSRVQTCFERSLVLCAEEPNPNLWLQYGTWADSTLKVASVALKVYERAVRHVQCSTVWQQYLTAMERANIPATEIDEKWPLARLTVTSADGGASLYRTYIYLLRRRASQKGDGDYSKVAELFDEGMKFLEENFGSHWDSPKAQFRKNYALFLYTLAKQPQKAHKVWNDILASGSGHLAAAWLEAANLERFFGDVRVARKLFYRAINSASDHPYSVFDALIQFEREVGTLEELDKALEKVNAQVARVEARPKKKVEKGPGGTVREEKPIDVAASVATKTSKEKKKLQEGLVRKNENSGEVGVLDVSGKGVASKVDRGETVSVKSSMKGEKRDVKRSAGSTNGHASDTQEKRPKLVDDDGFVVPTLVLPMKRRSSGESQGASPSTTKAGSSKGDTAESSKTIFISNLDFKLEKSRIEEIFRNAKEVRLVYRGMSKLHKGFGYVDFTNAEDARNALRHDRLAIDGRPMYVSPYKPHDRGDHADFKYATGTEKNKVFVNNVHYDATAEQLKVIFESFGKVSDIRIVTHKSGKSKGCAYVVYEDENAALAATRAEDIFLLERKLSVAISNPPKKKETNTPKLPSRNVGQSHNRVDLIPRALTRAKGLASKGTSEESSTTATSTGKLSNDQFRSFLKK